MKGISRGVATALRAVSSLTFAGLAATAWTAPPPVAPILVCADEGHFGTYAAEILRTEGLRELQVMAPREALAESSDLSRHDVVVLAESRLDTGQVGRLRRYVEAGGRLIAFRPSQELASVFGAVRVPGTLAEGYLRIGKTRLVGPGFSKDTLQFHGEADRYRLAGARPVATLATLYSDAHTATPFPAVFHARLQRGEAVLFAYTGGGGAARRGCRSWTTRGVAASPCGRWRGPTTSCSPARTLASKTSVGRTSACRSCWT